MTSKVTIGADPEFFVADNRSGGVVPICGLLGGTKRRPVPIPGVPKKFGEGFTMQEDNVMGEFNIPPCSDASLFEMRIRTALDGIKNYLSKYPHITIVRGESERFFHKGLLQDPKTKEFGCAPDFDSYRDGAPWELVNPKDLEEDDGEWRFAGGHIHIGYSAKIPPFVVANLADVLIGLPFCQLDKGLDKRKALYGQPGRFRPTSYGIEYRTPSNRWVFNRDYCYSMAQQALYLGNLLHGDITKLQAQYQEIPWGSVRECIISADRNACDQLIEYIQREVKLPVYGGGM